MVFLAKYMDFSQNLAATDDVRRRPMEVSSLCREHYHERESRPKLTVRLWTAEKLSRSSGSILFAYNR